MERCLTCQCAGRDREAQLLHQTEVPHAGGFRLHRTCAGCLAKHRLSLPQGQPVLSRALHPHPDLDSCGLPGSHHQASLLQHLPHRRLLLHHHQPPRQKCLWPDCHPYRPAAPAGPCGTVASAGCAWPYVPPEPLDPQPLGDQSAVAAETARTEVSHRAGCVGWQAHDLRQCHRGWLQDQRDFRAQLHQRHAAEERAAPAEPESSWSLGDHPAAT
mmetsp:Transcript_14396/g.26739  ORF Transcript_14396/g.26739 Transcript_14396/m.26739 type:complete len:215 (-) Transcript_14396:1238-1882(-)